MALSEHDHRVAAAEARQRDRRAQRHADQRRQQHGRQADDQREPDDREQRRIARQNKVQRGEVLGHRTIFSQTDR